MESVATTPGELYEESHHKYVYFVDGERQVSLVAHLTVREILSNAKVDPQDHYLVELHGHEQIEHKDLSTVVHLRQGEKFITVYHGPTPVS